ncbi:hypothetical protein VC83_03118 [Pseudogymnoascus destructans]|uniref:F-box domain-containing protein n=2 Tax=Pseudogymnoascus destructans TaxID=655981 RepID=L8FUL3_PSED2|nr:uncharacterized protein VC83_03118 [Pseudogymnoascus destructans]ELR04567.1 hypothetical protein, variant [Pseudogymnoascus destructans 20631-21]OAF60254.2 hypothetical protein VC83_03118 [Pseudogymnoascus destructans]
MSSLESLPNELWWAIASSLEIEDVISLSRTSRQLYQYVFSNQVSRAVAQAKIPLSREFISATQCRTSSAQALRKWAKKTEALTTAKPYSVAIVGVGQTYMYSKGALWYMHNGTLRLLETRQSPREELVVDLSSLLNKTAFKAQSKVAGSFSFLHYHEDVLSCLFRYAHPRRGGWLIAVDVKKPAILLSTEVASTEKLFARHDRDYLYYGVHISNDYDNRKRWVLHGYDLKNGKFLGRNNFLYDLIGAEIGSTICFEVVDGFFYAVSNQTTYEVEEVDWTSFYHGRRFPLSNTSEKKLDKTEDQRMWRRQHLEGPLDDRWTNLALAIDETTGQLTIVESRKEWLEGRTVGQRTVYKTKVVFPKRPVTENNSSSPPQANTAPALPPASPNTFQPFGTAPFQAQHPMDYPSSSPSSDEHQRRKEDLAALTQDRLALTITASNKPHFSPSQIRLPRNVHAESTTLPGQRSFIVTKTPVRCYDLSSSAFVDLVNDIPHPDPGVQQCLRIRACSRRRKGPARGGDGIIPPLARNPETGELEEEEGLDEEYEDGTVEMWPPAPDAQGKYSEGGRDLHVLMNPPGYMGKVHGTFDGTGLVYSTGGEGQKAIVLVNFDPAVYLRGLRKCSMDDLGSGGGAASATSRAFTSQESSGGASPKRPNSSIFTTAEYGMKASYHSPKRAKTTPSPPTPCPTEGPAPAPAVKQQPNCPWLRREAAMYLSISRGFDFGL